jgi:hypothetical protein
MASKEINYSLTQEEPLFKLLAGSSERICCMQMKAIGERFKDDEFGFRKVNGEAFNNSATSAQNYKTRTLWEDHGHLYICIVHL